MQNAFVFSSYEMKNVTANSSGFIYKKKNRKICVIIDASSCYVYVR